MRRASSSVEISAAEWAAMSLSRKWEGDFIRRPARSEASLDRLLRQRRNGDGAATAPAPARRGGGVSWPTSGCLGAAGVVVVFLVFFAVVVADALVVVALALALTFLRHELRELDALQASGSRPPCRAWAWRSAPGPAPASCHPGSGRRTGRQKRRPPRRPGWRSTDAFSTSPGPLAEGTGAASLWRQNVMVFVSFMSIS